jgi:DNA-binding YbaB/EbfC family protein
VSQPDLGALLEKAREAQEKLQQIQRDLAARRVEGNAGGGMVTAVVSGALRVLEVRIEPQLLASGDREMLQDLIAAALNAALTNAQQMIQQEMQAASAGLAGLGSILGDGGA